MCVRTTSNDLCPLSVIFRINWIFGVCGLVCVCMCVIGTCLGVHMCACGDQRRHWVACLILQSLSILVFESVLPWTWNPSVQLCWPTTHPRIHPSLPPQVRGSRTHAACPASAWVLGSELRAPSMYFIHWATQPQVSWSSRHCWQQTFEIHVVLSEGGAHEASLTPEKLWAVELYGCWGSEGTGLLSHTHAYTGNTKWIQWVI